MPKPKNRRIKFSQLKGIGELAFFVGLLLAIVAGFFNIEATSTILIVLGIIVGLINIVSRETTGFLVAAIALMLAASTGSEKILFGFWSLPVIGDWLQPILSNITQFVIPAAIIVSLKAVYELARKK